MNFNSNYFKFNITIPMLIFIYRNTRLLCIEYTAQKYLTHHTYLR
jgi:hypothetical protein